MIGLATDRVAPFGNPGITACLQLPQAYRSLPRPSSPPCAKASTVRPYALDLSVSGRFLNTTHTTRQLSKSKKKNDDRARQVRATHRSEERRVGKECRPRWSADHENKNTAGVR